MIGTAVEVYDRARALLAEHRPAEATALLDQATAMCDKGDPLLLRIRITRAWLLFEESGLAPALAELEDVADDAKSAGRRDIACAAKVQAGVLHARAGDREAAWRLLGRVDPAGLPPPDRMRLHINRGTIASDLHRFDDAAGELATAATLADELGATPIAYMARHNLGWVEFLRGDLPAALRDMHDADELDVNLDRSVARHDRARALLEAGLAAEAHDLLADARGGALGAHESAEVDLDLARTALLLGRDAEALSHSRAAARVFRRRGELVWHRRAVLTQLQAHPRMGAALALWRAATEASDREVAAQAAAVALRAPGWRPQQLEELCRDVTWLSRSPVVSLRMAALVALATAAARDGKPARARAILRRAADTLLRAQLGIASLDLRTATALYGEDAAALDLDLATPLGPAALVASAERWRAAARPVARLRPINEPRVKDAASDLRRRRVEFHPDAPDAPAAIRAIRAAERELRTLTWTAETVVPPTAATVPAATITAAAKEAGATVVVTMRRGDEVLAVLLGRRRRTVRLGDANEIAGLVEAVRADLTAQASLHPAHPLAGVVAASLAARLRELGDVVAAPLLDLPGMLVVVPTRVLSGVPWGALPGLRERPVMVAPTASSWATTGRVVERPAVSVLTGPGLPFAGDEAESVAAHWPVVRAVSFTEALTTTDLVHVAAHGEHRGDNPQFSSLLLPGGPVFAYELEGLAVRADHVVLSACEVGRATLRPGDQPLGFTATLLAAGVSCVVAPVAPIADEVAATTMGRYHAELASGAGAAQALASATSDQPAAGAFVCFGAPWRITR